MELALIVYLVATLGAIKTFVSGWWFWLFLTFLVCYVVTKLKLIQFSHNAVETALVTPKWSNIQDYSSVTLTKPIGKYNVGDVVVISKHSTYCYIGKAKGQMEERVDSGVLLDSIKQIEITTNTLTKTPLDANFGKLKVAALSMLVLHLLLPSEKTLQYAGGAYLIQTTYESGFVQEAGGLAGKAVINQLRKWSTDNPDIDSLLESVGETKGKLETVIPATDE